MRNIIAILVFFTISIASAQNHYYYYNGSKVSLTLDKSSLNISVSDDFKELFAVSTNYNKNIS